MASNIFVVLIGVLIFCGLNVLNIVKIVYAEKYKNDMESCSSMMDPYTWLFYDGLINLITWIVIVIIAFLGNVGAVIAGVIFLFKQLFSIVWLIIGSIMYWRDCMGALPSTIDNFIMVILILSYVLFCIK